MNRVAVILSVLIFPITAIAQREIPYEVPAVPWEEHLGNHRAVIQVDQASAVVRLNLQWRRHDKDVAKHPFLFIHAETGEPAANVHRIFVDPERCELLFGPVQKGTYYFYYLPCNVSSGWSGYGDTYMQPEKQPDVAWTKAFRVLESPPEGFPAAECIRIEARTSFNSFYPMEVIATKKEKQELAKRSGEPFLLFPEDRELPIRMLDNIPQRWIINQPADYFEGEPCRNEYYVFQIGLWAIGAIDEVTVTFSDLHGAGGSIPAASLTCFNLQGIDPKGHPFTKNINVQPGKVQPLWIGLDVPREIQPGSYSGKVLVNTSNAGKKEISLQLKIQDKVLPDRGDGEIWRHSRLRWLNSTAGLNEQNTAPYGPVRVLSDTRLNLTGKELTLSPDGLPSSLNVFGKPVLSSPVEFIILNNDSAIRFRLQSSQTISQNPGIIKRKTHQSHELANLTIHSEIESDGWLLYTCTLEAKKVLSLSDVRLNIPFRTDRSELLMGMGLPGTQTPDQHTAGWKGPHDSFWIGDADGGLYCELRGASYMGPMLTIYQPEFPESWFNGGNGGFNLQKAGNTRMATVKTGPRKLLKGEKIDFEFAFIITPVKPIDPHSQFTNRYYHNYPDPNPSKDDLAGDFFGIRILNLHHANKYNPFINYPFLVPNDLRRFVDRFHQRDIKVKIYYTIRELSNYTPEIWAFRSLGDEIFKDGNGGGSIWLREHLVDNYMPSWYEHVDSITTDAAIVTSAGISRWYNYYLEGLKWIVQEYTIDGLYLDDVTYDRSMLKRMRKIMNDIKPDCLIDLHSNTDFSKGPATQYLEFFPYIDKLWFGEGFEYEKMSPANWLVECSGIPFGLMGDMLNKGGNPWRGMVYGMTSRYPWVTNQNNLSKPYDIWKIWDDFGIQDSKMIGYWDDHAIVQTSDSDVKATAYLKNGKMLISLASWNPSPIDVKLKIDFARAGLNPEKIRLSAPNIPGFQPERSFDKNEIVHLEPARGWLIIAEEK